MKRKLTAVALGLVLAVSATACNHAPVSAEVRKAQPYYSVSYDVLGGEGEIQKIPAGDGESENQDTEKENTGSLDVRVEKYDSADEVPEEMWELKPSRINRQEVYIGRSEDTWYAAFEKDGAYWFAEADSATEEELTEYLRNVL